jgi:hypothetical protein
MNECVIYDVLVKGSLKKMFRKTVSKCIYICWEVEWKFLNIIYFFRAMMVLNPSNLESPIAEEM